MSYLMGFKTTVIFTLVVLRLCNGASLGVSKQNNSSPTLEVKSQGLYSVSEHIEIFTGRDLRERIFKQNHATFVEFYNSWCGFCQRFAPSWKALASDTQTWRSFVKIGAIDCANDDNTAICRELEIMSYPTLRFYSANSEDSKGTDIRKGRDEEALRHALVEQMRLEQVAGRGDHWPSLSVYPNKDTSALWLNVSDEVKYQFLIFEVDNTTFLGHEVTLDQHDIKDIKVRSVLDESALAKELNIVQRPGLAVVGRDLKIEILIPVNNTRHGFQQAIYGFLKNHGITLPKTDLNSSEKIYSGNWMDAHVPSDQEIMNVRERQAIDAKIKTMGDAVFQSDLEEAVKFTIYREISKYPKIANEEISALRNYLTVLAKYFRLGPGGQVFLTNLRDSMQTKDEITGEEFLSVVKSLDGNNSVFSSKHWIGCQGSTQGYRGFPCGLWTLFHHLTVSAADNPVADAQEVLQAMFGYVKYFFGCSDCSKHFQELAAKNKIWNVARTDEAILWLWSAHNEVNKRLSKDITEDPEHPKVQFPTAANCPLCHKSNSNNWDHFEVLNYLKSIHAKYNISLLGIDTNVFVAYKDSYVSQKIFSGIDMSLCLVLYIVCALVLVFAIRMFLRKSYRKKTYIHDILGKV